MTLEHRNWSSMVGKPLSDKRCSLLFGKALYCNIREMWSSFLPLMATAVTNRKQRNVLVVDQWFLMFFIYYQPPFFS